MGGSVGNTARLFSTGPVSLDNINISETTFHRVRELIVRGKLAPGSRVVEADLADRLGVSRTPIRAALHRLQQEGYILVAMGGGGKARLSIAPLTHDDARELYQIIGHLEGLAARTTAQLEPLVRCKLVQRLKELNDGLRELADSRRSDPNRIFDLDMNFHQAIVDASAGPRLGAIHAATKPQAERYWRLYASAIVDQLGISIGEHMVIMQCIENGDSDGAERAILMNWKNGAERLVRVIETLGERGSW
ncbi:MAG TPA: GntR family transcriptional regulator [Terriglobia bacterium]|nr:GntR family transcriptional regulator [Terriglobia bacterium]